MKKFYLIAIVAFVLCAGKANAQVSVHAGYQHPSRRISGLSVGYNGFYLGGTYNINVVNDLAVAPGAFFGYASLNGSSEIDFRIPVLANYGIDVSRDIRLFGFAGPMISINLMSNMSEEHFNRFDLGLMFGAGLKYKKISAEIGYDIGLLNRIDHVNAKINHFVVGIGYSF